MQSTLSRFFVLALSSVFLFDSVSVNAAEGDLFVFIGTYTEAKSKGIYVCRFSPDGKITQPTVAAETRNPSFLAVHPNQRFLYAVNEISNFEEVKAGAVSAFSIAPDGKLTFLNQISSGGADPCHLTVDRSGKSVLVANYSGGNAEVVRIEENGRLGRRTDFVQHKGSGSVLPRQQTPLAHCVALDMGNKFAAIADLGLDKVLVYKFDPDLGTLTPNNPPSVSLAPGSGPRHFVFGADGRHAYLINEMNSTLTTFSYNSSEGTLKELQTLSTLPAEFREDTSTAELVMHPSGKFIYGSNRGHNSIVVFKVDPKTGMLTWVQTESTQGKIPRGFGIDPSGRFLLAANQNSDNIVVFRIDLATGRLHSTGQTINVPSPVDIKFVKIP